MKDYLAIGLLGSALGFNTFRKKEKESRIGQRENFSGLLVNVYSWFFGIIVIFLKPWFIIFVLFRDISTVTVADVKLRT